MMESVQNVVPITYPPASTVTAEVPVCEMISDIYQLPKKSITESVVFVNVQIVQMNFKNRHFTARAATTNQSVMKHK